MIYGVSTFGDCFGEVGAYTMQDEHALKRTIRRACCPMAVAFDARF